MNLMCHCLRINPECLHCLGSAKFPKPSSCPVISQMSGTTNHSPRNSDAQCFSPKHIPHLASIFFTDIDRVYRNVCQKEETGLKVIEVADVSYLSICL